MNCGLVTHIFLRFLSNISNTRKSVSSDIQTLRTGFEKTRRSLLFFDCKTFKQATGTMIPLVYVGSI